MQRIAIFPGTFDPITLGHEHLINRAAKLFDKLIVAVAENQEKQCKFAFNTRIDVVKARFKHISNIEVVGFESLLVQLAEKYSSKYIVRGIRNANEFAYELQLSNMNRSLDKELETIFLFADQTYSFISSSLVKEAARLGADLTPFVSPEVIELFN